MTLYSPLCAALVAFVLIKFLISSSISNKVLDVPNDRSLHHNPVSRLGGVGLILAIICGWAFSFNALVWWVVLPLFGLFFISLIDDVYRMSVKQRMLSHLLAAAIVVTGSGLAKELGLEMTFVVLLMIVWMTNLYNFMDGSDGLAGGMALIGFSAYGIAAGIANNLEMAMLNLSIAAAAVSFLYFNFQPAKIFMGDAGSIPLGFLAATLGVQGWQLGIWSMWFPIMIFSPFIVDSSVTLIKRSIRREKITEAHREHYYQRLVQMDWSHRQVAIAEYILMLSVGITAISVLQQSFPWQAILIWCAVYSLVLFIIDKRWKNYMREKNV